MALLEISGSSSMRREAVADRLRLLADQLARHNDLEFVRDGIRFTVDVPDEVVFDIELEIGDDGNELEIEIKW